MGGGTYRRIEVNGMAKMVGDVVCESCEVNGSAEMGGSLRVDGRLEVNGRMTAVGPIAAGAFEVNGMCDVDGNCADEIEFELVGKSTVREIGCTTLKVSVGKGGWFSKPRLEVETIEGDEIDVEAVLARRIRGDVVVIGDDAGSIASNTEPRLSGADRRWSGRRCKSDARGRWSWNMKGSRISS